MIDPRTPCLVGVAQRTVRREDGPAPEPLELWADAAADAAADAGLRELPDLDSIQVTYCQSWQYDAPVDRLAERLGADPKHRHYSGIGGTTGQVLVARAAERILAGESEAALVCGAEALDTLKGYGRNGQSPPWSFPFPGEHAMPFEDGFEAGETAVGLNNGAAAGFALWDSARRARLGIGIEAYQRAVGTTMSDLSRVAAANPYAWFRQVRDAEFLATPGPDNRMVAHPYTKYTCAIMDVDMASAVLVTSEATADRLGVPREQRVYPRGWAYATDPPFIAERADLSASDAMATASREALRCAGVAIGEVAHLDLYSCFASSVHFARDALGIAEDDPRPLTVTGGLPYFGGPASNYMLHSIASTVERLRADRDAFGLVSGVGMSMSKHAVGVYSTTPPTSVPVPSAPVDLPAARTLARDVTGPGRVVAYTVLHGRTGEPVTGIAVCDAADGARTYASFTDPALLAQVESEEFVGADVSLTGAGPSSVLVV